MADLAPMQAGMATKKVHLDSAKAHLEVAIEDLKKSAVLMPGTADCDVNALMADPFDMASLEVALRYAETALQEAKMATYRHERYSTAIADTPRIKRVRS